MKRISKFFLIFSLLFACFGSITAARESTDTKPSLRMPALLSDRAVIQRNTKACIWGWAEPGARVVVKASWTRGSFRTKASEDGKWKLYVPTGDASYSESLAVRSGKESLTVNELMIGDVWICSGQSNMQWKVSQSLDVVKLAQKPDSLIRIFNSGRIASYEPLDDYEGTVWETTAKREALMAFSAVGYAFGSYIRPALDCPLGLVCLSYGGTPVEGWTPEDCLTEPEWKAANATLLGMEKTDERKFRLATGTLYNANIAPALNMKVKGVLWYQGCHNVKYSAGIYGDMLENMIKSWRLKFAEPELPFYIVEIVPHTYKGITGALVREGQFRTSQKLDNVEFICTIDQTDPKGGIHPRYKCVIGRRLSDAVLATAYGREDILFKAPCLSGVEIEGEYIRVRFDNLEGGLFCDKDEITGCEIAGEDGNFVPASARIEGDTLVVSGDTLSAPRYVRYCFDETVGHLRDARGMPVVQFRTDSF